MKFGSSCGQIFVHLLLFSGQQPFSVNKHIDYVKKQVSKMLVIFSRVRPSLTTESANRLFKSMILPILDYCGAVFHRCGKGNEEGLECLQRQGGRIVLNTAHLSTEQMVTSLD